MFNLVYFVNNLSLDIQRSHTKKKNILLREKSHTITYYENKVVQE